MAPWEQGPQRCARGARAILNRRVSRIGSRKDALSHLPARHRAGRAIKAQPGRLPLLPRRHLPTPVAAYAGPAGAALCPPARCRPAALRKAPASAHIAGASPEMPASLLRPVGSGGLAAPPVPPSALPAGAWRGARGSLGRAGPGPGRGRGAAAACSGLCRPALSPRGPWMHF